VLISEVQVLREAGWFEAAKVTAPSLAARVPPRVQLETTRVVQRESRRTNQTATGARRTESGTPECDSGVRARMGTEADLILKVPPTYGTIANKRRSADTAAGRACTTPKQADAGCKGTAWDGRS
jgi:hypothetical protein